MVLAESMACGLPPVAFQCPCGPKDIIHNNQDGILVENGNISQLAEKLIFLIENENIRKNGYYCTKQHTKIKNRKYSKAME